MRCVYLIINDDTRQAYAGLTNQFGRRISDHRKQKPFLFVGKHAVFRTELMTDALAQRTEASAVRYLRAIGFDTVNVSKAGSLGGSTWSWTKDRCAVEALKYRTRTAFEKGNKAAYTASQRKGWLNDVCAHMDLAIRPKGFWTKERCAAAALEYSTAREFLHGCGSAYDAARRNGWLRDVCRHMVLSQKSRGYWTKERCAVEARKYNTKTELMANAKGVYNTAHKNGWIDDICSHMTQLKRGPKPGHRERYAGCNA